MALSIGDSDISTAGDVDENLVMSDDNMVTVVMADNYGVGEEVNKDEFGQYISEDIVGNLQIVEEDTTYKAVEVEGVVNINVDEDVNLADEQTLSEKT